MKFLVMHKHDPSTEAGAKPTPEFIAKMGKLVGGMAAQGKLLDGAGLGATATRSRLSVRANGERTVQHGPYTTKHNNELPARVAMVKVKSRDEAIDHATALAKATGGDGDVDIEVGKVTEPWDLGMMPKPADAPERYLVVTKATAATEAGKLADVSAVNKKLSDAGVLLSSLDLKPSSYAKRMTWKTGRSTVVDGPFTESKELIGGFALLVFDSMDECVAFTREYADLMLSGGADWLEIDIRPV